MMVNSPDPEEVRTGRFSCAAAAGPGRRGDSGPVRWPRASSMGRHCPASSGDDWRRYRVRYRRERWGTAEAEDQHGTGQWHEREQ